MSHFSRLNITSSKLLEFITLKLLSERSYSAHELADRLRLAGILVPIGSIYPLLNGLRHRGLAARGREESETGGSMLAYCITLKGCTRFKAMKKGWDRLNRLIAGM